MCVLRPSLRRNETQSQTIRTELHVIICICRGKSDREINRAIGDGARTVRDLQRCGIGDRCGSCHSSLRTMLAAAPPVITAAAAQPCPACQPALASASV